MSSKLIVSLPPHTKSTITTPGIMKSVIIALIPTILCSVFVYGSLSFLTYVAGIAFCIIFEWLFCKVQGIKSSVNDFSAVITGILLIMCLPPYVPLWVVGVGSFVAIVAGKMVFGGLGQNPFNPALLGRTVLLVSFPVQMTGWSFNNIPFISIDAISTATPLGAAQSVIISGAELPEMSFDAFHMLVLGSGGSLGEVSALAVILGGVYLIIKRIISWHIPIIYILTVFIFSGILWFFNIGQVLDPLTQIFTGGLMLAAFFMATDYSSSPMFTPGKLIFGFGCGIITVLIRVYGIYPEGVGFAILIMNAFVPLLDKFFKPHVFGRSV